MGHRPGLADVLGDCGRGAGGTAETTAAGVVGLDDTIAALTGFSDPVRSTTSPTAETLSLEISVSLPLSSAIMMDIFPLGRSKVMSLTVPTMIPFSSMTCLPTIFSRERKFFSK